MTIIYLLDGNEIFRVREVGALWQADKKFKAKFGRWPDKETTLVERKTNEDHERK